MKKYLFVSVFCFVGLFTITAQAQNLVVKGVVTNRVTDEVIDGVSIVLLGKPNKTVGVTDKKGNFSISIPPNSVLLFSHIGFIKLTQRITDSKMLEIRLEDDQSVISEVVVRGYQSKSRDLSSGSSTLISGKELQDIPVANVEQLLQGKVAGLNIQNNTGAPGFRGAVLLRGLSNIDVQGTGESSYLAATSPLYVIDGIPVDVDGDEASGFNATGAVSPLALIPPEDIAGIEVLKDAQATSLYGSRGAYGVILITTKRGKSLVPKIRYSNNFFLNTPPKLRETLGGKAERDAKIKQIFGYGAADDILNRLASAPYLADSLNPYYNNSTNWQDIIYASTYNQSHNITIDGGDPIFSYKTNFGYYKEKGIIKNTGYSRYNLNMNMDYRPNNKFSLSANLMGSLGNRAKGDGLGLLQPSVATNGASSSLTPPPSFFLASNSIISSINVRNTNPTKSLRTSLNINYRPFKGFAIGSTGSYDLITSTEDTYTPAAANAQSAKVRSYNDTKYTIYNRNNLSYNRAINKIHDFSLNIFNEVYIKGFQSYVAEQNRLPSDSYIGPLGFDASFLSSGGGGLLAYQRANQVSFAGAFSYNFKRKYVLDLSYRIDANSYSGVDNPYSKSPAIGLRWNFNKENCFNKAKWLNYGSLRLSWGKSLVPTGNVFAVYGTYNPNGTYNGRPRIGLNYGTIPNTNLGAGTSTTYNLGLDAGFLQNKLEIGFDTYIRRMDKQTKFLDLSNITGFGNILSNDVSILNYGYELTLTVRPLSNQSKVYWQFSINGAINNDVLTHLPGGVSQIISGSTVFHVGRNSLSNYLFNNLGVYATDADVPVNPATGLRLRNATNATAFFKAGDPIFEDVDGDYVITDADRKVMGNSQPLITGGFNTEISYKNFSFRINGSYTFKRDIISAALAERLRYMGDPFGQKVVLPVEGLRYWKGVGDNSAIFPNPYDYTRASPVNPFRTNQSIFQSSGSYLKINSITFSYAFNKQLLKKIKLASLRAFVSANNVYTFSSFTGPNAENVTALGYDVAGGYPPARSYAIGLNVDF